MNNLIKATFRDGSPAEDSSCHPVWGSDTYLYLAADDHEPLWTGVFKDRGAVDQLLREQPTWTLLHAEEYDGELLHAAHGQMLQVRGETITTSRDDLPELLTRSLLSAGWRVCLAPANDPVFDG